MNKVTTVLTGCGLLLVALIGSSGCSLSKPYPAKQLYAIDVGEAKAATGSALGATLRILRVRVAEPFSDREFQYLIAPNQFQQDYYANFVADPDRLLTSEIVEWMSSAGLYTTVVDASSSVRADRALQCVVSQLYGDMSDAGSPKAVLSARFFLLDETDIDAKVLFSKDYQQTEPTGESGADSLTQAWGSALKKVLEQLTADLRAANLADTRR